MDKASATIRELRLNFRSIQRKVEQFGSVVITDNGEPKFTISPHRRPPAKRRPLPDYYALLLQQRSKPLSAEKTAAFYEEDRER